MGQELVLLLDTGQELLQLLASVIAGALEGSNVNATTALVEMIEAARSWDTQIKLLTTARDLDTETASLMRLPS